jgi:hypothetical protein
VYEGNDQEASDHISAVTHTSAYGGASVFRLRHDSSYQDQPVAFAPPYQSSVQNPFFVPPSPYVQAARPGIVKEVLHNISLEAAGGTGVLKRALIRTCIHRLFGQ